MNYIKYQLSNGVWIKTYAPDHRQSNHPSIRWKCYRECDAFAYLIQDIHEAYDNNIPFEGYHIIKIEEKLGSGNVINFQEISIY